MGVGEDPVCLDVGKEYVGEKEEFFWPMRQKRYDCCKGRRNASGEEADQYLKELTKLDIAAASHLATDRETWREIIKVTVAERHLTTERERERERGGRGREREGEGERGGRERGERERERDIERGRERGREREREGEKEGGEREGEREKRERERQR